MSIPRWVAIVGVTTVIVGLIATIRPAVAEDIRVGTPAANNFTFLPLHIGIEKGIFSKYGLNVEANDFGGGARLQQAVVAGSIDIAVSSGSDFAFVVKGAPETAIAAMANNPTMGLVVRYDFPGKTGEDLKGKKVGVTTAGSFTEWLFRHYMKFRGWGPDDVKLVTVGSELSNQVALLTTGQIDGVVAPFGLGLQLELDKRGRLLFSSFEIGAEFLSNAIFASNKLLHDNPDAARRFLKGWFETIAWMRTHKAETVAIVRRYTGYVPEVEGKEYDLIISNFSTDGKFKPSSVQALANSFVDMKTFEALPNLSKFYTEAYLPGPAN
jgi:ABC-type nitrate/sulfonate/bicarbonate transport system substrate-binding protein